MQIIVADYSCFLQKDQGQIKHLFEVFGKTRFIVIN